MIVVGGVYQERCRFPRWDRIFGSGMRAAVALSELSTTVELHGYVAESLSDDVAATLPAFGIANRLQSSKTAFTFNYLHPFDKEGWTPEEWPRERDLNVEGDNVLRFGLMEGEAIVHAERTVYDPQAPLPKSFGANGSRTGELAIVATASEVIALTGAEPPPEGKVPGEDAIRGALARLFDSEPSLQAILIKDALGGLRLYQGDEGTTIPTYAAESYFRIGAGDIIAAGFAHAWAEERRPVREAADFAARCLAYAMEGPRLPLSRAGVAAAHPAPSAALRKLRIVGGETLELQALAFHTQGWIEMLGGQATIDADVIEPHVTIALVGERPRIDVLKRLAALTRAPSVVYWPDATDGEVERWFGPAVLARDFASALYRAMRTPA